MTKASLQNMNSRSSGSRSDGGNNKNNSKKTSRKAICSTHRAEMKRY